MSQLAKNALLASTILGVLLVITATRKNWLAKPTPAASVTQPRVETVETPRSHRSMPRPRVLQAQPVMQEPGFISPSSPHYEPTEQNTPQPAVRDSESMTVDSEFNESPYPVTNLRPELETPLPRNWQAASTAEPEVSEAHSAELATQEPTKSLELPTHIVTKENDSFWSISERAYGTGAYYRALFHHNRLKVLRPDQLRAGIELALPAVADLHRLYPDDCP